MNFVIKWVLFTNVAAVASSIAFFYFEKGSTVSVIGLFAWLCNFMQSFVLFLYVQVKVFDHELRGCQSSAVDKNTAYVWSLDIALAYIILQYVKIVILLAGAIFAKF